jgi:hypothetical protein
MRTPIIALLSLFAVAAAPVPVKTPSTFKVKAPNGYTVSMQIFEEKGLVAAPKLFTAGSEDAKVRIGDRMQLFEMIVTPIAPGQFEINGNLVQWTKTGLLSDDVKASVRADGKPHCLTLEKFDVESGKRTPMHVDITISPRVKGGAQG